MKFIYFIRNVFTGLLVVALLIATTILCINWVWGIPILISAFVFFLYLVFCWDRACDEYEKKHSKSDSASNEPHEWVPIGESEDYHSDEWIASETKRLREEMKKLKEENPYLGKDIE